ncbi:hypothetical protein [Spiroplasma turonicum]|uniref:Uncharacterized protein n=1 Tax=Spiroplasma turonicum TaxID=216946 RepID=A0A0K1P781_9MOLU|nr:hypothetical protein [Spiroplasma turonicum]AKU80181.1 hypothetical protein STURON_00935 [Spiroplasma turonicum]ALX71182.1 hypothetical protein STURO_v1c09310 [Spiroplasma turonicum]
MKKSLQILLTIIIVILTTLQFFINGSNIKNDMQYNIYDNQLNIKNKVEKNAKAVGWGGLAIQYFIFVHSDILQNKYISELKDSYLSTNTFNNQKNLISKQNIFYSSVVSSALLLSLYSTTDYNEFFAESVSKWQTFDDSIKNKSWEILNYFFLNIYKILKANTPGRLKDFNYIKNIIDEDFKKEESKSLIFHTNLEKPQTDLTYEDLYYVDDNFGMKNLYSYDYLYGFVPNVLDYSLNAWTYTLNNNSPQYSFKYSYKRYNSENIKPVLKKFNQESFNITELRKVK